MGKTEQTKIQVFLDGRQPAKQLDELGIKAKELKMHIRDAMNRNDAHQVAKYQQELENVKKRMRILRTETFDVTKVLNNLSGASLSDLQKSIKRVNKALESPAIKRNSKGYRELIAKRRTLIAAEKRLRRELDGTNASLSKFAGILKSLTFFGGGFIGALYAASGELRRSLYAFNSFQDAFQNLSALTGLVGEKLDYLKEKAKKTSTEIIEGGIRIRQSATEILNAYTVVGSQRPELLKNKEALHDVTVEAIILSEAAKMKLDPATRALTTSLNQFNLKSSNSRRVINALAAGSMEGAGDINYLAAAIEKSGTTANIMNVEYEDLVAVIEVLAPKFSQASMAGNSLDKVLLKMKSSGIGYRDGVFSISAAIEDMNGKNGKSIDMVKTFGVEHVKTAEILRASGTEYERYREAVTGTNTALEQAKKNTDTNSARLAAYKNELQRARIELGEKFTPLVATFTKLSTKSTRALMSLIEFSTRHYGVMITLGFAILSATFRIKAYNFFMAAKIALSKRGTIAVNAQTIAMRAQLLAIKLKTVALGHATMQEKRHVAAIRAKITATKAANAAMKKTPWGAIAAGVSIAVMALINYVEKLNATRKAHAKLNADIMSEKTEMNLLFDELKRANEGSATRKEIIKQLNEKYGEYLPKLLTEKTTLEEIGSIQEKANISLVRNLALKAKASEIEKASQNSLDEYKKSYDRLLKAIERRNGKSISAIVAAELRDAINTEIRGYEDYAKYSKHIENMVRITGLSRLYLGRSVFELRTIQNKQKENIKSINSYYDEFIKTMTGYSETVESVTDVEKTKMDTIEEVTDDEKSALEKRLKAEAEYRAEVLKAAQSEMQRENAAYEERLKKAGIFGKKRKELNAEELSVLRLLEKEHHEKIAKIRSKAERDNTYRSEVLKRSADKIKQENDEYEERLKNAHLFGKKREVLTEEDLKILTILEREHAAKIKKINSEALKEKEQKAWETIRQQIDTEKYAHNAAIDALYERKHKELEAFKGSQTERREIIEKYQLEEKELVRAHTRKLIDIIQSMLQPGTVQGLSLADVMLSKEDKNKLQSELTELRKELETQFPELFNADKAAKKESNVRPDILGMSQGDWIVLMDNLKNAKIGLEEITKVKDVLLNAWGTYDKFMSAMESRQLKKFEKNAKRKRNALDKQLEAGEISQERYNAKIAQMDADLDAKRAELERKQAIRQKAMSIVDAIINTAVGVTSALKVTPPAGIILASIIGTMGAAQVATIAAQPLPGAEKGGYLNVVRRQDGRPFVAKQDPGRRGYIDSPTVIVGESGEEFVASAEAVRNPSVRPVLDIIDAAQRNGTIARLNIPSYISSNISGRAHGGFVANTTTVPYREQKNAHIEFPESGRDSKLVSMLEKCSSLMDHLIGCELHVSMYGKNGLMPAIRKAEKIEKQNIIRK